MNDQKSFIKQIALDWLTKFEESITTQNFSSAKELFYSDVLSYGTVVECVDSLSELTNKQWKPVWSNTVKFHFIKESLSIISSEQETILTIMAMWQSYGLSGADKFLRTGRSTIVLKKLEDSTNIYKAIHSHFSKTPDGRL